LFNLNFNHSFNQTPVFVKPTSTKSTFYKTTFFQTTTTTATTIPNTLKIPNKTEFKPYVGNRTDIDIAFGFHAGNGNFLWLDAIWTNKVES